MNKKAGRKILGRTCFIMILISLLLITGITACFRSYEEGILDVCAEEQDGYVQLVVDQINLNKDRSDEQIINDILNTLDAAGSQYWTFSQDENILFVKDIMETNKYRGISADSYYQSESASAFINSLNESTVSHDEIEVDGTAYIASGTSFVYNGHEYRLVLLSNRSVFLDNNKFLGAKTSLIVLIAAAIILMMLVPMGMAWFIDHQNSSLNEEENENVHLRRSLDRAGDELLAGHNHHEHTIWNLTLLDECLQKLKKRGIPSACLAVFHFESDEDRDQFLQNSFLKKTMVFSDGRETDILFIDESRQNVQEQLKKFSIQPENLTMLDLQEAEHE